MAEQFTPARAPRLSFPLGAKLALAFLPVVCAASFAPRAAAAPAPGAPLHVLVDPGHGGIDRGATRGALRESEIALRVSLALVDLLRADPRFRVSLTRDNDKMIGLDHRVEISKNVKADVVLSIHANSSEDPRASGTEFYIQNQLPVDEEAMFLASKENQGHEGAEREAPKPERLSPANDVRGILEDLNRNYRLAASGDLSKFLLQVWSSPFTRNNSRVIRQAPFRLVSNVDVPSVLVELGFITHPVEGPRLATAAYQRELAHNLFAGLVKFKEVVDKDRPQ